MVVVFHLSSATKRTAPQQQHSPGLFSISQDTMKAIVMTGVLIQCHRYDDDTNIVWLRLRPAIVLNYTYYMYFNLLLCAHNQLESPKP